MMNVSGGMHDWGLGYGYGYGYGWIIGLMILFTVIWIGIMIYKRSNNTGQ